MQLPSFFKGSLLLTLAMLFSRGAVVIASALVARAFGAEAFALFTFVHLTATALSNLAMLGMMNGLPRFCARMTVDASADALSQALLAGGVVIIGLAVAIGAVLALPAELIGLPDPARKGVLVALTLGIGLTNLLTGINNGFERFGHVAVSSLLLGIMLIGGTLIAILLDAPEWPLRVYLAATFAAMIVLAPSVIRRFAGRFRMHGAPIRSTNVQAVRAYLGPMLIATTLTNTGLWLAGRSLIGGAGGAQAYAEFALGMQWFGLAQMASNVISRTIMPRLTRNAWNEDRDDQRRTIRQATLFSVVGAVAVSAMFALLSPLLLQFYGTELQSGQGAVVLFICAALVASPIAVLLSVLVAEAKYAVVFSSTLVWWMITVFGAMLFADGGAIPVIVCALGGYLGQLAILCLRNRMHPA